jgi:hypothetical protein
MSLEIDSLSRLLESFGQAFERAWIFSVGVVGALSSILAIAMVFG